MSRDEYPCGAKVRNVKNEIKGLDSASIFINWVQVSKHLTKKGCKDCIRRSKIPEMYKKPVQEIVNKVNEWRENNDN